MGDYLVDAPDRQGAGEIFLARMGEPFLVVSRNTTTILDADGHRVLYQWVRDKPSFISYAAFDRARQAWVENVDFGADGIVDFRSTEISGEPVKEELKVGNRWLEFVKRDGKTGVVMDGKFMSIGDARKQLAAAENSIQ